MFKAKDNQNNENDNFEEDYSKSDEYKQFMEQLKAYDKRREEFKNINISSKEEAIKFLKSINDGEELSWAYNYSITDELKTDKDIFEYIKNKFIFTEEDLYRVHASGVVETYGSACGKSNNKEIIKQALNEVKNFSKEHSLIAYWIFYALNAENPIPFETYINVYKLFEHNITIQGYLLNHYSTGRKREKHDGEMIRLLDVSSEECIKKNWFFAMSDDLCTLSIYHVLLRNGIDKEKLDESYNRHIYYQRKYEEEQIKKQEEHAKCLRREKRKQWRNKWKR